MVENPVEPGLVTIVIPSFNYGHFISETLDSVLTQSYDKWDCIVVDDGSTDGTEAIVGAYVRADSRVRYIYQRNCGLSSARNRGIEMGRGEYFQFLDADDLIESRKLGCHVGYLEEHQDVGIVYSPVRYFGTERTHERKYSMREPDQPWMPKTSGRGLVVISALARENIMAVNCPLVRRSVITRSGMFAERLRALEDWEYWIRCALHDTWFQYVDELATYALVRDHHGSLSKNELEMARASLALYQRAARAAQDPTARALFSSKLGSARHAVYVQQLRHGMPIRGALNGLIVGLLQGHYQLLFSCLVGLALLPFIGTKRFVSLLLDVAWTKVVKRYHSR